MRALALLIALPMVVLADQPVTLTNGQMCTVNPAGFVYGCTPPPPDSAAVDEARAAQRDAYERGRVDAEYEAARQNQALADTQAQAELAMLRAQQQQAYSAVREAEVQRTRDSYYLTTCESRGGVVTCSANGGCTCSALAMPVTDTAYQRAQQPSKNESPALPSYDDVVAAQRPAPLVDLGAAAQCDATGPVERAINNVVRRMRDAIFGPPNPPRIEERRCN